MKVLLLAFVLAGSALARLEEQQLPLLTRTAPPFRYAPSSVYGEPAPEVLDVRKPAAAAALPPTSYGVPDYKGQRATRQRIPGFQGFQGFQGYPRHQAGVPRPGYQQQSQYSPQPYDFDYKVNDEFGNDFGHQEASDGRVTRGSYSVLLPDGRRQIVQYEADEAGFRPRVTYERVGGQAGPYEARRPGLRYY